MSLWIIGQVVLSPPLLRATAVSLNSLIMVLFIQGEVCYPMSLYILGAVGVIPSPSSVSEESEDMISIGSINVDVVHGDLTKERTDAIVNGSNNTLDLPGGVLSNA